MGAGRFLLALSLTFSAAAAEGTPTRVNQDRIEARIMALSEFGRDEKGATSRVAYSDADLAGRGYVIGLMRQANLSVHIDAGGNIIGSRAGSEPSLKPIMIGSHIDSVPEGGNYDGDVGSVGAIEVAQVLEENGTELRHPLHVIIFANEEGALAGSRAIVGRMTESALNEMSQSGFTHRDGIRRLGGDPSKLAAPLIQKGDLAAFVELHIEQGDTLYERELDIGVVEGIVGIRWWNVTISGHANHAGTTRMSVRRDALVAASKFVVAVNETALGMEGRQVATVGRITAEPGAPNVIPGIARTSLEIRDLDSEKMQKVFDAIRQRANEIATTTGTQIEFEELDLGAKPILTDPDIRSVIQQASDELGYSSLLMPSGAGHDAQEMATIAPTGMIFVPSVKGISHSPEEFTSAKDMANGANTLLHTVLALDSRR